MRNSDALRKAFRILKRNWKDYCLANSLCLVLTASLVSSFQFLTSDTFNGPAMTLVSLFMILMSAFVYALYPLLDDIALEHLKGGKYPWISKAVYLKENASNIIMRALFTGFIVSFAATTIVIVIGLISAAVLSVLGDVGMTNAIASLSGRLNRFLSAEISNPLQFINLGLIIIQSNWIMSTLFETRIWLMKDDKKISRIYIISGVINLSLLMNISLNQWSDYSAITIIILTAITYFVVSSVALINAIVINEINREIGANFLKKNIKPNTNISDT